MPEEDGVCPMIAHSTVSGPIAGNYNITCHNGYNLVDKSTGAVNKRQEFKCTSDDVWSPFLPACLPSK